MALCSCGGRPAYSAVDRGTYVEVTRLSDGASDWLEASWASYDFSDGSSLRARYIGTMEEMMGIYVIKASGQYAGREFAGAKLSSLSMEEWHIDGEAMGLWLDERI